MKRSPCEDGSSLSFSHIMWPRRRGIEREKSTLGFNLEAFLLFFSVKLVLWLLCNSFPFLITPHSQRLHPSTLLHAAPKLTLSQDTFIEMTIFFNN